jgi:hypothetical protein
VANVPVASNSNYGVVKTYSIYGISMHQSGNLCISPATEAIIKAGTDWFKPLGVRTMKESTFYGLAKAAGSDEKNSTLPVGQYTDEAKVAIQKMLGISQMLAPENPNLVASQAYAIGDVFTANGKLYKATAAIAQDEAIIPDTNCVETTMAEAGGKIKDVQVNGTSVVQNGVANIPFAGGSRLGVIKTGTGNGIYVDSTNGEAYISCATDAFIKAGANKYRPVVPGNQHQSAFYGLAKAAGDTTQAASSNAVGTYTYAAKEAIRNMIWAFGPSNISANSGLTVDMDPDSGEIYLSADVRDVQINGTSILSNGVANIPIASSDNVGVVKVDSNYGIGMRDAPNQSTIRIAPARDDNIKRGEQSYQPITPYYQHKSVFYGLAKAAGDTT